MGKNLVGPRHHPDFVWFWLGQTVSVFGDQISALALPLVAIMTLQAGPSQTGMLAAAASLPMLVLGLPAGVILDRVNRRRAMIVADSGRALLLTSVPAFALLGMLGIWYLCVVALLMGALTVVFNVAYQSFLPSVIPRERLVEANSRISASRSIASAAGPGLAGLVVQAFTAPFAILLDACSFAVSAACLSAMRGKEEAPLPAPRRTIQDVAAGLRVVAANPLLRASAGTAATYNTFNALLGSVYLLYLSRFLSIDAATLGILLAVVGVGSFVGALLSPMAARRFGVGPTMIGGIAVAGSANLFIATTLFARHLPVVVTVLLLGASFANGFGQPFYNVSQAGVRQAITPSGLLGRVNATMQFVASATAPAGALVGGFLGQAAGLWPAVLVGALGTTFAATWLVFSPVRAVDSLDQLTPITSSR